MQSVAITAAEAPTVTAVIESRWLALMPLVAANGAWFMAMHRELGTSGLMAAVGPDTIEDAQGLLMFTKRLHVAATQLSNGQAYLQPWQSREEGTHVAVVLNAGLPQGAELGVWPIAVMMMGVSLAGMASYVVVQRWNSEVMALAQENEALQIKVLQRVQAMAETLVKTDPAAAAKLGEANAKAIAASNVALRHPQGWLEKALGSVGAGAAIGGGVSTITILGVLWLMSRKGST